MIKNSTFLQEFLKKLKKLTKGVSKRFQDFSQKYPQASQNIQLTFIYFFALIDLFHSVLNNVFSLGYFPEIIKPFLPFIQGVLLSPLFQIWASPEKVFFLSYIVIELMVVRSTFKFSKLVKYNILLIFALLMLQGLVVSYWDILFHREISAPIAKWALDKGALIYTDKNLAVTFFLNTFLIFILGYIYLYIRALQGKFATIPTMDWLTDSIAFWLRIKTPTMRVGKRKKTIEKSSLEEEEPEEDDAKETDEEENIEDDDDTLEEEK
jgi:hypothetical protein